MKQAEIGTDELVFDVIDGRLVLTFDSDQLTVCAECPRLHLVVLPVGSAHNIRKLAAGLSHLAGHVT